MFRLIKCGQVNCVHICRRNLYHEDVRWLNYLIPSLSQREKDYIGSQTEEILNRKIQGSKDDEISGSADEKPFKSTSSEFKERRLRCLFDTFDIKDEKVRSAGYQMLNRISEGEKKKISYQCTAARILMYARHEPSPGFPLDPQIFNSFFSSNSNPKLVEHFQMQTEENSKLIQSLVGRGVQYPGQKSLQSNNYRDWKYGDQVHLHSRYNYARNLYILQHHLGTDISVLGRKQELLYGGLSRTGFILQPLELLIHLNVLDRLVSQNLSLDLRREVIKRRFDVMLRRWKSGSHNFYLDETFPDVKFFSMMRDAGFSHKEASELLMSNTPEMMMNVFKVNKQVSNQFNGDKLMATQALKQRFQEIKDYEERTENKLSHREYFQLMMKCDGSDSNYDLHYSNLLRETKRNTLVRSVNQILGSNQSARLSTALSKHHAARSSHVIRNIDLLLFEGFSLEQVELGLELIIHPTDVIQHKLSQIDDGSLTFADDGKDLRKDPKILAILAYHLEKDRGFPSMTRMKTKLGSPGYLYQSRLENPKNLYSTKSLREHEVNSPLVLQARGFHTTPNNQLMVHIQNPLKWIKIQLMFLQLKEQWDPNLRKDEFEEGVKLAVSSISQNIADNNFDALKGLVSKTELKRLKTEVEKDWDDVVRRNAGIELSDIQKTFITDLRTQQIVNNKYLDIDVAVFALKKDHGTPFKIYHFEARFHRDYSDGRLPDWIVTRFKLTVKPVQPIFGG